MFVDRTNFFTSGAGNLPRQPFLVWGAGAIGGTVAAYLRRAGIELKVVDINGEHVEAMRQSGLTIEGPVGEFSQPLEAATPDELTGTYECILLAVKAQHTEDVLHRALCHLSPGGVIISLQNGLSERVIASHAGEAATIGALVNFAADYLAPGRIMYGSRGAFVLGEITLALSPRVEYLARIFSVFEPEARATDDIWSYKWSKLAYGSLLFATALSNNTISDTLSDARYRHLLRRLAGEVILVARTLGVEPRGFDGFEPQFFLESASDAQLIASLSDIANHYRKSGKQRSGVWRDMAIRRRKTEVEAQLGDVIRLADEHGVDVRCNRKLVKLICEIEDGKRELQHSNLDELLAST